MTEFEKAARAALEALKEGKPFLDEDAAQTKYWKAIADLSSALEQPAQQEPVAYIRKDQLQKAAQSPMLCEIAPEPRQDRIGIYTRPQPVSNPDELPAQDEPVAWMIWTHGPVLVFMNKDEANLEFDRLNHAYPEPTRMLVPLYTRPQAREPLTQDMVESCPYDGETLRGAYFEGWLKAEAAHGIGEKK